MPMTLTFIAIAAIALQVLAVIFILRSIQTARTSQGAVAWASFLFFLPFIAVPVYLFLGNWRYHGYIIARRKAHAVMTSVKQLKTEFGATDLDPGDLQSCFEGIADLPIVHGNRMSLLTDWQDAFGTMFKAMDDAKDYILVQFYIVKDDELGRDLQKAMIRAAERGVKVRFLYDAVGSKDITADFLSELKDAGVEALDINRPSNLKSRFQVNFRNHRKTVVVDGHVGFTGGFNVGDEYAGRDPKFGKWRDTHCELRGPMVSQLQLIFAEDWYDASKDDITDRLTRNTPMDEANMNGVIIATGPADDLDNGALYFCAMIHAAQERIWIATPYLIAENDIVAALKLAVLRGVDVRLLLPKGRDHWITWLAAFAYFDELREAGVEIWLYQDGFMHQKVILVDERISSVGTINLDNRSCRLNFEATAVTFDTDVANATADMLEADFAVSKVLEKSLSDQPRYIRHGAPVARLFSPLL